MSERFVARVWLPDRPGELGQIATALGEANLSLIGIEIIEQGGGWAVDELDIETVGELDTDASNYITNAFEQIIDVRVESVTAVIGDVVDARVDALQTAAELIEVESRDELAATIVERAVHDFSADWSVLIESGKPIATTGDSPTIEWIVAFMYGSRAATVDNDSFNGPQDIAWAETIDTTLALVVGRDGRPFRARERAQVSTLTRIVGTLWSRFWV